ncbi:hypothetical protein ACXET9_06740 [Brachybacterium sp. DNPG3]
MSAPPAPPASAPSAPTPDPGAGGGARVLEQEVPRRRGDFGLNVKRLRRTRIIVFAILALPIALLALLALRFVSLPLTQAWHDAAYDDARYDTAIERLAPVQTANWFEPYLPHLTEGTDLLQQGQNAEAEVELRVALEEWQDASDLNQPQHAQCKILNNLAISIERQADEIEDAGERADRLYEAEELLAVCAGGGGGGEGGGGGGEGNEDQETTGDNGERVQEKRREADEEAGNDPADRDTEKGGGSPMDPGDPTREDPTGEEDPEEAVTDGPSTDPSKEDEVEQRNKDAQGGEGETETGGEEQDPAQPW